MPQRTLRFKIHQDGRVEETVEGFIGKACNDATKNLENSLGEVKVKNQSSDAFPTKLKIQVKLTTNLMSHFSTIKTELKEVKPLIKALNQLGYSINQEKKYVKGYKGRVTDVDISMELQGNTMVGFKFNKNSNSYELVTDVDLWNLDLPVERFISKVTQMYAYHTIISKTEEDGYQVVEQQNKNDGSIELVLTKWEN